MLDNLEIIIPEVLVSRSHALKMDGYRYITSTCCDNADNTLDVYYHFDKNYEMASLKLTVERGQNVPSISNVFFCAVLVENEMSELFGLKVTNMALDYGGKLLLSEGAPDNPMSRGNITIVQKGKEGAN